MQKEHPFASYAMAGAGSAAIASSITYPLDTLKTLLQVGAGPGYKLSLSQVAESVRSASGIAGFYSGIGWSMLANISGVGARFGVYEILTAFYKDGRADNYVYVSEALLAGMAAGVVEAMVRTPFELLKLRKQLTAASSLGSLNSVKSVRHFSLVSSNLLQGRLIDSKSWSQTLDLLSVLPKRGANVTGELKRHPWMLTGSGRPPIASQVKDPLDVISLEGWGALWRGLRPGIARDCVFGGVFFSTWQFFHIGLLNWKSLDINPPPRSLDEVGPLSPLATCVSAAISAMLAAALSHSFDTSVTRAQSVVIPKYICMEWKLLKYKARGNWIERLTGMFPSDRRITLRGAGTRMARCGIASYALVGAYLLALEHGVCG